MSKTTLAHGTTARHRGQRQTATPASMECRIPSGAERVRPARCEAEDSLAQPRCRLARFLFGRPLGRRASLETLVRNRLAALDREAVRTGAETGLGTLDSGELFA